MVIIPQPQHYVRWSQRPDLSTIMEQSSGYFYCHLTIDSNIRTPTRQITHAVTSQGIILFSYGATVPSVSEPPHYRGFTLTLRHTAIGGTPLDEWSALRRDLYLRTHNTHHTQTSMAPVGFEPVIPEGERLQTHALELAASSIRRWAYSFLFFFYFFVFDARIMFKFFPRNGWFSVQFQILDYWHRID
jgi:hypothetical protein